MNKEKEDKEKEASTTDLPNTDTPSTVVSDKNSHESKKLKVMTDMAEISKKQFNMEKTAEKIKGLKDLLKLYKFRNNVEKIAETEEKLVKEIEKQLSED